jgi:hypothetical protein
MSMYFLMCSERSGSNLITKLLDGHSDICGPSTKHIFNPVVRNLFRYEPLSKAANWNALLQDIDRLMNVEFSVWRKTFSLDELARLAPAGDIVALIRNIFQEEAKANRKKHVFVKENHVYEFFPFLLINFPDARYVYQTRDPRDMALSWKKSPNHPGGIVRAARQWQKDQQSSLKNFNELQKLGKACFLRYEDLISEPEKHLDEVVSFLGLEKENCHLDFHGNELTQMNADMHEGWSNLSRGVISGNKEKYRKELSENEIKVIEKICYYEMMYLGYEPENELHDLDRVTSEDIDSLDKIECRDIPYCRSKGVKANMKAKKIFYQRMV